MLHHFTVRQFTEGKEDNLQNSDCNGLAGKNWQKTGRLLSNTALSMAAEPRNLFPILPEKHPKPDLRKIHKI